MALNTLTILQSTGDIVNLVVMFLSGIAVTFIVATIIGRTLKKFFLHLAKKIKVDETQFIVLRRVIIAIVYAFGITITLSAIPGFENAWLSVLTGAGVLAVVVGFAAQKTFGNVISGIFIALFRPFRVGDKISIKGHYGRVEDITLMHTIIETGDNTRLVIPNSVITDETIVNYSAKEDDVIRTIDIGISYDSDIDKARKIMLEEAHRHPHIHEATKTMDFLKKGQKCVVRVTEFKDSSVNLRLIFWAKDFPTAVITGFELLESIKKRFDKEGIEIPYPYRTIVYKKDTEKKTKPKRKQKKRKNKK